LVKPESSPPGPTSSTPSARRRRDQFLSELLLIDPSHHGLDRVGHD